MYNDNAEFTLGYVCNRPVKPGDTAANTVHTFSVSVVHIKSYVVEFHKKRPGKLSLINMGTRKFDFMEN